MHAACVGDQAMDGRLNEVHEVCSPGTKSDQSVCAVVVLDTVRIHDHTDRGMDSGVMTG